MPDTDALFTAGVLAERLPDGRARALDLFDRAVASAPQAVDIGLLDIIACTKQPGWDALKRETRMRGVDPRNGNFWMVALRNATKRVDQPRIDTALAGMAQTSSFDLYFLPMGLRLVATLKRIPTAPDVDGLPADMPSDVARLLQARSLIIGFAMPSMQDLVEACKPGTPAGDARRTNCRAIADSLRHSDMTITKMIGLRLQEWSARDAADRNNAIATRRLLQWKMIELGDETYSSMPRAEQTRTILAHENEVEGIDAVLRATGRPLVPPAGWQPLQPAPASTTQNRP